MSPWIQAFLIFLPAGIANMTPPVANKIPYLNQWITPLDLGKSFRGIRLFGTNKTWRGLITGTICGTLAGALLYPFFVDTDWKVYILRCAAISAGALIGDAVESFFKRQHGVPPGSAWFPFDQLDYIVFGLAFMVPFGLPSADILLRILVVYFFGVMVVTYISYHLGFKEKPI